MFSDAVYGRDSVVVELAVKHGTRERMGSSILQMRVDSKGTYDATRVTNMQHRRTKKLELTFHNEGSSE